MATTVTAATLSIRITESITLNGVARNGGTTLSIESVKTISNRIIEVTNAEHGTELITISTTAGPGQYDKTAVKYMRMTNLDDTNFVTIMFATGDGDGGAGKSWTVKLEAGKSYVVGDLSLINDDDDIDDYATGATNVARIVALADTAAVDVELYIAST